MTEQLPSYCCKDFAARVGRMGTGAAIVMVKYETGSNGIPEYYINYWHYDDGENYTDYQILYCPFCGAKL